MPVHEKYQLVPLISKSLIPKELIAKHLAFRSLPLLLFILIFLSGCTSTQSGSGYQGADVGPSIGGFQQQLGSNKKVYSYNKTTYLDVAIPIIDPGFPMKNGYIDEDELVEEQIWPEIRRLESKRFSINIRDAIMKTKSFGSVSVVPGLGSSADLYVIGRINKSNTLKTKIGITLVDATNKKWGEKDFRVKASVGFYRETGNETKDPNRHLYTEIANWVYQMVMAKRQSDLDNIKLVSDMRFAALYAPQTFNQYLEEKRGVIKLTGVPADSDQLLQRIREYKAQDATFIDSLQQEYDKFQANTESAYRAYQKESLPIQVEVEEQKAARNTATVLGVLGAVAAVAGQNQESKSGDVVSVISAVASAWSVKNAIESNEAMKEYTNVYDEMGENLKLKMSDQVKTFENTEVKLIGTAAEQYAQWQAHLLNLYRSNQTPDVSL